MIEAVHQGHQFTAVRTRRQALRQRSGVDARSFRRESVQRVKAPARDQAAEADGCNDPESADQDRGLVMGTHQRLSRPGVDANEHRGRRDRRPGPQHISQSHEDHAVFAHDRQSSGSENACRWRTCTAIEGPALRIDDPDPQSAIADQRIVQMMAKIQKIIGLLNFVDVVLHHIGFAFQFDSFGAQQLSFQRPVEQRTHRSENRQCDQPQQEGQASGDRCRGSRAGHSVSST